MLRDDVKVLQTFQRTDTPTDVKLITSSPRPQFAVGKYPMSGTYRALLPLQQKKYWLCSILVQYGSLDNQYPIVCPTVGHNKMCTACQTHSLCLGQAKHVGNPLIRNRPFNCEFVLPRKLILPFLQTWNQFMLLPASASVATGVWRINRVF